MIGYNLRTHHHCIVNKLDCHLVAIKWIWIESRANNWIPVQSLILRGRNIGRHFNFCHKMKSVVFCEQNIGQSPHTYFWTWMLPSCFANSKMVKEFFLWIGKKDKNKKCNCIFLRIKPIFVFFNIDSFFVF